jgi:hypothetical protein
MSASPTYFNYTEAFRTGSLSFFAAVRRPSIVQLHPLRALKIFTKKSDGLVAKKATFVKVFTNKPH